MQRFDVAIAGFGPVGAAAACLLAKHGARVIIFDQERKIYDKPRAIGMDQEAMRILQECGIAGKLKDHVRPFQGGQWLGVDGEPIARYVPHPGPYPLGWSPNVTFFQPVLETALRERVAEFANVSVLLGHRVKNVTQKCAVLIRAEEVDTGACAEYEADYLLACDGASSTIRTQFGIELHDYAFDEWWVVVDAFLKRETPLPPRNTQYCWPSRPATYINGPQGLKRWELKLLPGETPDAVRSPETLARIMSPYVDPEALDVWRSAVYRFHALVARTWRKERVFLVGDSAHQTPPFLGQGLCSGLRDADNIAWRILHVEQHGLRPETLADYERERAPHVCSLIERAKEFGSLIGELDVDRARIRDESMREKMRNQGVGTLRQSLIPGLRHGLIATDGRGQPLPGAGELCPQPVVRDGNGAVCLLFDVLPARFALLAGSPAASLWLSQAGRSLAERLGATTAVIGQGIPTSSGWHSYQETSTLFLDFLQARDAEFIIVRPDRYVYGVAKSASGLASLLQDLAMATLPDADEHETVFRKAG